MVEFQNDADSRAIQADLLGRRYPQVRELLSNNEELLSVSQRKPMRVTGVFCIMIGAIFAVQVSAFTLFSHPGWTMTAILASLALIWTGIWLAFLIKNEYVFVTDVRIVHWRVNLLGRSAKTPLSILLSDIDGVHLYRDTLMFRSFNKNTNGDILVRKKTGKTYLIPTLKESVNISETIIDEVRIYKARSRV